MEQNARRPPRMGPWNWLPVSIFAVFSVGGAWNSDRVGLTPWYEYWLGTPTTATIATCSEIKFPPVRTCTANWTVDGVIHRGVIEGPVKGLSTGMQVNAHARGEYAYLAYWAFPYYNAVFGVILAAFFVATYAFYRKQKTGRWPWAGR